MAVEITLKKSDISATTPPSTSLSSAELAINTADGVVWYGDSSGTRQFLVQEIDIGTNEYPAGHSHRGRLYLRSDTNELKVCTSSGSGGNAAWATIGTPTGGLDVEHPLTVKDNAGVNEYMKTSDSVKSYNGSDNRGIIVPFLEATGAVHTTTSLSTNGPLVVDGAAGIDGDTVINGNLSVGGSLTKSPNGSYTFHNDANLPSGRIMFRAQNTMPPDDSEGENGDFWYGI